MPHSTLAADFGNLLASGMGSDVTLLVSEKNFRVHKVILSARSSVFRTMFESRFKEGAAREVDIQDIDSEVMEDLLAFIYTGAVRNVTGVEGTELLDRWERILLGADRFGLEALFREAETVISSQLSNGNAARILSTTLRVPAARSLRNEALLFVERFPLGETELDSLDAEALKAIIKARETKTGQRVGDD